MEITLNELLAGKGTRIKNNTYFSAEAYVTPFLERMSKFTNDFKVQARLPDQISITRKEDLNLDDIVFNRVWIQAILPDEMQIENHKESINLLYALDTRKPIVKIARTAINCACLNLCVFSPYFIDVQELDAEKPINYSILTHLMEMSSDISMWLNKLKSIEVSYDRENRDFILGNWINNILDPNVNYYNNRVNKVKLSINTAIDAYKSIYFDEESPYYVKEGESTSMFNIYNAFTDLISHDKRDIVNPIEKTILLKSILQFS